MSEKRVCFISRAGRGQGSDIAGDEPSHIHLPRRRRVVHPVDQGPSVAGGDEGCATAPFALDDRQAAGHRS